jgi:hypothetical protein
MNSLIRIRDIIVANCIVLTIFCVVLPCMTLEVKQEIFLNGIVNTKYRVRIF